MEFYDKKIRVTAIWDSEAGVWVAASDDVPGLVTEADTSEQLVQKLRVLIPELLELNGMLSDFSHNSIPFHLLCERTEMISYSKCNG